MYKQDGSEVLGAMDSVVLSDHYIFAKHKDGWDVYNQFGRKLNEYSCESILGEQSKRIGIKRSSYWGWLNFNGDQEVKCKYDAIDFGIDDQSFIIKYVDKWGVADFDDHFVIAPEYDRIEKVGNLYVAHKGYSKRIFTPEGKQIYHTSEWISGDEILLIGDGQDSLRAVLPSGHLIENTFSKAEKIKDYYRFKRGKFTALCDAEGRYVIRFSDEIQEISTPAEDRFLIKKNNSYGFVDAQGRLRIANRYDAATSFSEGLAPVKLIGKWGFLNIDERLVIQPFYDQVSQFQDGLTIVKRGEYYGIVDKQGEEVVDIKWESIGRQKSGNFVVVDAEGNYGLVDKQGGVIYAPIFEYLEDTGMDLVIAQKGGKKGVMNYDGYTKYPFVHAEIEAHDGYLLFLK